MITLTPYTHADRDAYISLYEQAFPACERKPPEFMLTDRDYDLWVISTPEVRVAGMVITVRHRELVLLDYLAVLPELRGQGIGHEVLPLVRRQYTDAHLFLEIEEPDESADNAGQRRRRKAFYLSAGLVECGVRVRMYGTDMELLAYPEDAPCVTFEGYTALVAEKFPDSMSLPEIKS